MWCFGQRCRCSQKPPFRLALWFPSLILSSSLQECLPQVCKGGPPGDRWTASTEYTSAFQRRRTVPLPRLRWGTILAWRFSCTTGTLPILAEVGRNLQSSLLHRTHLRYAKELSTPANSPLSCQYLLLRAETLSTALSILSVCSITVPSCLVADKGRFCYLCLALRWSPLSEQNQRSHSIMPISPNPSRGVSTNFRWLLVKAAFLEWRYSCRCHRSPDGFLQ